MLTHNCTETGWFSKAAQACSALCFTHGRIRFWGTKGTSPTCGQVFFYFGPNLDRFKAAFARIGTVLGIKGSRAYRPAFNAVMTEAGTDVRVGRALAG
jgi:hypothetical protein